MTRFRFRFAVVLKARERTRDSARAALADALRTLNDAEQSRRETLAQMKADSAELAAATAGGRVDAADWIARRRHFSVLDADRSAGDAKVADAAIAVATARTALVAADRDVAALETLRDRDRDAHRHAELAAEQRASEDLFTASAAAESFGETALH
ncbi:flagellar export protein FliJ [Alienimonas chondri]|uniref:Flagellar FliJ protein n=1 Tax=Alienimonas chondri TaxID=2681879 RepID=A0ABX1VGM7_9PLAN|nr:flagellar export protein FliJ [Alienimonas chondri]NNJ26992.1 hypothetical protein [Alienimonas chondri]